MIIMDSGLLKEGLGEIFKEADAVTGISFD